MKKYKLHSFRLSSYEYGKQMAFVDGDEVGQEINVQHDGTVTVARFYFQGEGLPPVTRIRYSGRITHEEAAKLLADLYEVYSKVGAGNHASVANRNTWELTLFDSEGGIAECSDDLGHIVIDLQLTLTKYMRELFGIEDLTGFLGVLGNRLRRIRHIDILYTSPVPVQVLKAYGHDPVKVYRERLSIDRKSSEIRYTRYVSTRGTVTTSFHFDDIVANILDYFDSEALLSHIAGYSMPSELKGKASYEITIDYEWGKERTIKGVFDKEGLPVDFAEFIERVREYLNVSTLKQLIDPSVYNQRRG